MNKKIIATTFLISTLFTSYANYAKADNTTQLIIEKTLNPDRKTGFLLASELIPLQNIKIKSATTFASKPTMVKLEALKEKEKTYSILEEPNSFSSLIVVKNDSGEEIKRISVARKATKIIKSEKNQRLFVLCEGYFGSVWEIDPKLNQVVRKFSTAWNPTDIAISEDEKYLYVTSGKFQKFSLESDVVLETELPQEVRHLGAIHVLSNKTIFNALNKDGLEYSYILNKSQNKLEKYNELIAYKKSTEQKVMKEAFYLTNAQDTMMIYSKNNDYAYVFSKILGKIEGLVALDAKVDDLLVMPKLNKALALHRMIGQISLIDLTPKANTQYSVIARITDERLKDPSNAMVLEGNKVFIKSDLSQEGYIDTDNLLRYTSPVVEIPVNKENEVIGVSLLANKTYSLKNGQLFVEDINDPVNAVKKLRLTSFGTSLGGLVMKSDSKSFFLSDMSRNKIIQVDTFTGNVIGEMDAGNEPSQLAIDDKNLYVLNQGDNTISTLDLNSLKTIKTTRLKVDNNALNLIKLYDKEFEQILKVNLPSDVNKELLMARVSN